MAGIFLEAGQTGYNVVNNGDVVFGSTGTETVTLGSSTTNIEVDANAEQVNFAGAITDYKFAQAGNVLKVYSGSTLVAEVVTDGSSLVKFASADAVALAITSGTMSINGSLTALNVTGSIDASTKDLSQFTAGITVDNGDDTSAITLILTAAQADALAGSVTKGADDKLAIATVADGTDLSVLTLTDVDSVELAENASVTMAAAQVSALTITAANTLGTEETITINTLDGATVLTTDASDVFSYISGDAGAVIQEFVSGGNDLIAVDALLTDNAVDSGATDFEAFDGTKAATNDNIVNFTSSATLSADDVKAKFEASDSDAALMVLADGDQVIFVNQDDDGTSGTDYDAQIFLVDTTGTTITATLVGTIDNASDSSALVFGDFA